VIGRVGSKNCSREFCVRQKCGDLKCDRQDKKGDIDRGEDMNIATGRGEFSRRRYSKTNRKITADSV